jgi:hypothetical protein
MIHYFFKGTGEEIKGVQPSKSEREHVRSRVR